MGKRTSPLRINTFSFGFRGGLGEQRRMDAPDQHNEIELNFIPRGEMILQHGAKTVTIRAGDMAIYWAAIPHQVILVAPKTQVAWLSLPLSWFLAWNLPAQFSRRIFNGEVLRISPDKNPPGAPPDRLMQWTADLRLRSPQVDRIVELDLEAFFRRLALHFASLRWQRRSRKADKTATVATSQYGHVQNMVKFMTEHFRDAISVPQIAAIARLNPEYAMRLFRKTWGMTLWEFLLQQRISEAQRLLVLGDRKVSDIAFTCGFASLSQFYSAFQKRCRCAPNQYRRSQRSAVLLTR
jgi:AraC-like DNA-binding protein